ncbi:RagB/SusD family nutrient uptake outer membrane protein [Flavihumibacter solisilvae]|uniref:RagB/SusD domain-containing protein n=1 Tax=Flavihumibacter solisilvae TaxID=1349421 RepID=A0A0C1KYS3_9BACT|nr:RagB/SusD family nutrient uptake outer membrane protein [Flavihumibacter solisilvae]KIC92852.1 hypothetical protein OI18_20760 [Flavihumibacter solisilvae]
MNPVYKRCVILAAAVSLISSSCTKTEYVVNPNAPTQESVLKNASRVQINQLGVGVQSVVRNGLFSFYTWSGSIGRETVYFAQTESRYYRELQGEIPLDPAGIMYDWYNSYNQTRRRAELLLRSATETNSITDGEKKAVEGFAKTIQAYAMLNCLNMMGEVGVRTSFSDLNVPGDLLKPGCFNSYSQSLDYVKKLADDGLAALDVAGSTDFPFTMVAGWTGFATPADFKKFNRAVAARVAMYREDWLGMETALSGSFLSLNGNLKTGPYMQFSTTANDAVNPMWRSAENNSTPMLVQVNFVDEAETGDKRVFGASVPANGEAKVRMRTTPSAPPDYPLMTHEVQMYATNVSPISIIRNEELVLMYAEAKLQQDDLAAAVSTLDIIRQAYGLQVLAIARPAVIGNKVLLIDELLNQRRYSLFMEGHRWFDMRRYDKLDELPLDKPEHHVYTNFVKPQQEVDWDATNPCQ